MKYLNLGCGARFHPDWTNVDFNSSGKYIVAADLLKGIPFPDETFNVVYSSHLIEHLTHDQAVLLTNECYRVLKSGGILRISTPDLELLVNKYLEAKERAAKNDPGWDANYEWIVLHMFDQVSRNFSGGYMRKFLLSDKAINMEYVVNLLGPEAQRIKDAPKSSGLEKVASLLKKEGIISTAHTIFKHLQKKSLARNTFLKLILGNEYELLEIGRFRKSGECHYHLYDGYSLKGFLKDRGFTEVEIQTAARSRIPAWNSFHLDTKEDGAIYRPDSLYVEGVKL